MMAYATGSLIIFLVAYKGTDFPVALDLQLDTVEMEFYDSHRFIVNNTAFDGGLWDSTNSQSGGFVRLGQDRRVFSIAMFHQLHCVARLHGGLNDNTGDEWQIHHIQHCMNYLRQLFLCAADATLEPGDVLKEAEDLPPVERLSY